MIIGIDGNEANIKNRVGVGRYAFELLKQFGKNQKSNVKYQIYLKEKPLPDLPIESENWKYKVIGPKKFWTQIGLPFDLFFEKEKPDVFFTPTHYAPRFSTCPRVISIMDLSFLKYPEMFKKNDLWQLKSWTGYSVKKAAKILTISQSSKNDIIDYYRVPEDKVIVTYPGFNKIKDNMVHVPKKYGIEGEYILSVGTIQPRKNYEKLIEAFSTLDPNPYTLVIVGKKGWLYEKILKAPEKNGVKNQVKFLEFVPNEDLPFLYKNAKCFVLVSLYEGFGLPVLEAMNYGCPVVVSNVSSLPEIAGQVGTLVNPDSVGEIAKGIRKILELDDSQRKAMIEQGQMLAKKFSWEKCAKETLDTLEKVAGK